MNYTIMPEMNQEIKTDSPCAHPGGELDQGRGDEHESGPLETVQTFAEKLRAAGYQEPVLPSAKVSACDFCGYELGSKSCLGSHTEGAMVFRSAEDEKYSTAGKIKSNVTEPLPVVSREGFRAGVLSAIAGGLVIACFYLAWGIVAACLFTAVCIGFVAGMLITQEWK